MFCQYIKNKKNKYEIKFYELCNDDGYILNIEIYTGKYNDEEVSVSKTCQLVKRLARPYLRKSHHLYMDNYYNSIQLFEDLLKANTHSTDMLRKNRKRIPAVVSKCKLKKGHVWRRRDVLTIPTGHVIDMRKVEN